MNKQIVFFMKHILCYFLAIFTIILSQQTHGQKINIAHEKSIDSEQALLDGLKAAKDDTVRQYYHGRLFWLYYNQPRKFAHHFVEGSRIRGNNWSMAQIMFIPIFFENTNQINKEFLALLDNYTKKKDNIGAITTLTALSYFEPQPEIKLQYLTKAKELNERVKDRVIETILNVNIADVHIGSKDYQKAMAIKTAAIDTFEQLGCHVWAITVQNNLSLMFWNLRQFDTAYYLQEKALKEAERLGANKAFVFMGLQFLMKINTATDRPDGISLNETLIERSIPLLPYVHAHTPKMVFYLTCAHQETAKGNRQKADYYFTLARQELEADKGSDVANAKLMYLDERFQTYYFNKQYKESIDIMMGQLIPLKDSLDRAASSTELNNLLVKYEVAKKDRALAIAKTNSKAQQAWFLAGSALFLVLAIGIIVYFNNRNKILQLKKLIQVRNTIASDLHDEVGSTLSSISMMSQIAQKQNDGKQNSLLQTISHNSQQMLESMNDIVWSINPKNDKLEDMLSRMRLFASETLESKDVAVFFNVPHSILNIPIAMEKRKDIYLIFKEAINNIAKYAAATNVTINISQEEKNIHLQIKDNGKGLPTEPKSGFGGNGIRNMKERAAQIDASLTLTSYANTGLTIDLSIPY